MEILSGKRSIHWTPRAFVEKIHAYPRAWLDLGAGDGKVVLAAARRHPEMCAIGLDACRENLVDSARRAPDNAIFLIANALSLPDELTNCATNLTINFPWGSLLAGLLEPDGAILEQLHRCCRPGATLEVRLNQGALREQNATFESAANHLAQSLPLAGFYKPRLIHLDANGLRASGATWGKRVACGPAPAGLLLQTHRKG